MKVFWKQQSVKGPLSAALIYGQAFHRALHTSFGGGDPRPKVEETFDYLFKGQPIPDERENANWDGTIKFGVNDLPAAEMLPWILEAVDVYRKAVPGIPDVSELELSRDYGFFDLLGVVDALWGGTIVDFKLASPRYKPDPLQAAIYALVSGGPSPAEFHIIRKKARPELDVIPIPEANNQRYLDFVTELVVIPAAHAISAGNFVANDGYMFCDERWCEYWHVCKGKYVQS